MGVDHQVTHHAYITFRLVCGTGARDALCATALCATATGVAEDGLSGLPQCPE